MANRSGTVTSSRGYVTVDTTPNDTLAITVSSGTYSIEYPLGTLIASGATASASYSVGAGQAKIICNSGSIDYALTDNNDGTPLTPSESTSVRAMVSAAGIRFNDKSAAAANVTALQAALTAGGIVNVIGSGIVWINDTLVIGSDTTLTLMAGVTIKLVDGSQKRMLQNVAFSAAPLSVTSFTASGYVGTVSRTAHGRAVGDWVAIEGATTTGYNGTYRIESVPDANTYTVTLPIAPSTTTAAGTIVEYAADKNITIQGGTWHGNGQNRTPAGDLRDIGMLLARVGGLRIDSAVKHPRKYCWLLANCSNVSGGTLYVENAYSDGLHIMGPIIGLNVDGVQGFSNDDFFACTLGDYVAYQVSTGDMYGIHVGQLAGRTNLAGFKITGQAPFKLYDARVDHLRIAPGTDAVSIIADTNLQQTNVGSLSFGYFEDLACNASRGGIYTNWNGSGTVTVDSISLDSVRLRPPSNVNHALIYNVNGACTIKRVSISHIDAVGPTAGASAAPRVVRQIGDVTELSIAGRVENYAAIYDHDSAGSASGQRVYINGLTMVGCNQGIGFRRAITVQSNGWETTSTGTAALSSGSAATCTFIGQIKADAGKYTNLSGSARVTPYSSTLQVAGGFVTGATGASFYNTDAAWVSGTGTDKSGQYGYTGSAWTKLYGPA